MFARVEGKLNILASLVILKSDREVVRLITRRLLSEFYDVEQRTILTRPGTTCSEMEEIFRASYDNRKTKALEERKLAAVMSATAPSVDPHAVGGGFQANSGGRRLVVLNSSRTATAWWCWTAAASATATVWWRWIAAASAAAVAVRWYRVTAAAPGRRSALPPTSPAAAAATTCGDWLGWKH